MRTSWLTRTVKLACAFLCALSCARSGAAANAAPLKVVHVIDATAPFSVFAPGVGVEASPAGSPQEVLEALDLFEDRAAAVRRLHAMSAGSGPGKPKGTLYATFTYKSESEWPVELRVRCGVAHPRPGKELDPQELIETDSGVRHRGDLSRGTWRSFKRATRAERVRIIAECLAQYDGMPPLRSTRSRVTHLHVDPTLEHQARDYFVKTAASSALATAALQAPRDKILAGLKCLAQAAGENSGAAGGHVVLKRLSYKTDYVVTREEWLPKIGPLGGRTVVQESHTAHQWAVAFAVVDTAAQVDHLWEQERPEQWSGIWKLGMGFPGMTAGGQEHPIGLALYHGLKDLEVCRKRAGLTAPPSVASAASAARGVSTAASAR